MSARRSLLTATAAGALLGALWFVPSANATSPSSGDAPQVRHAEQQSASAPAAHGSTGRLADTGGFDTTPYVIGGTAFLGLGAGFVAFSVRRERTAGGVAHRGPSPAA
ncbi:LPXTG cell wall anchor domain-containing protein [Streptomyces flavofungini]|uniref:LPXTG cell wall anchor domain-containing protein n=1 Tax=Streptomyces flavofungini TaxID=68200 RepID=UPI0034DEDD48